jgi:outer membrane murein-binding lipoprotein Lpp
MFETQPPGRANGPLTALPRMRDTRGMRKTLKWTTIALIAGLVAALPQAGPSTAAQADKQARKIRELKRDVRALRRSREYWRDRAWAAEDSVIDGLAAQITVLAQRGRVSELHPMVFEPVRVNWPCGATVFQGNAIWDLTVNLSDTRFEGDDVIEVDCSG